MKFYHGTTKKVWNLIQEEGLLYGRTKEKHRSTSLYTRKDLAAQWGDVILEVEYEPGQQDEFGPFDTWTKSCWQFRTYQPISIQNIRVVPM